MRGHIAPHGPAVALQAANCHLTVSLLITKPRQWSYYTAAIAMIYGPKQFRESLAVIYTPESGRLTDVQGPAASDQQLGRHHPHQQLNNPRHLADPVNPQNDLMLPCVSLKPSLGHGSIWAENLLRKMSTNDKASTWASFAKWTRWKIVMYTSRWLLSSSINSPLSATRSDDAFDRKLPREQTE